MPCGLRGGQMTDLFGRALAPVNRTAPLALLMVERKAKATSAIFGRYSSPSPASIALTQSLVNKLIKPFHGDGGIAQQWTWKGRITPLRRQYFALMPMGGAHQRKRLYWLANSCRTGWERRKPVQLASVTKKAPFAQYGDTVVRARCALDGDFINLLSDDGVSVVMERRRIHGYGNAIHIGSAIAFIQAAQEAVEPDRIAAE